MVKSLLKDLTDFCYPHACSVCDAEARRWPLCEDCDAKLMALEEHPYCPLCAMPLASHGAPCPHCMGHGVRPYEQIARLGNYDDPIRQLIHALKFHRAWAVGEFLAERLFEHAHTKQLLADADLIIPVPLHPLRQMTRGYNQAQIIATRLAKLAGKRIGSPIVRLVATEAQTSVQSRTQRIANLWNAFGLLHPRRVTMKRIVVIDDVRTTAATLQAVGRCLKEAAPASLNVIVIAAADPKHSDFTRI